MKKKNNCGNFFSTEKNLYNETWKNCPCQRRIPIKMVFLLTKVPLLVSIQTVSWRHDVRVSLEISLISTKLLLLWKNHTNTAYDKDQTKDEKKNEHCQYSWDDRMGAIGVNID